MASTIPPAGSKSESKIIKDTPRFSLAEFPIALAWTVEYPDGDVQRGMNILLSQTALNSVMRQLREEQDFGGAKVSTKLVKCPELSTGVRVLRVCEDARHNRKGEPQETFCHECGKKTRLVAFLDGE